MNFRLFSAKNFQTFDCHSLAFGVKIFPPGWASHRLFRFAIYSIVRTSLFSFGFMYHMKSCVVFDDPLLEEVMELRFIFSKLLDYLAAL
jgi:hypothetical protein